MSMWVAGQLLGRIDARWLVGTGLLIAAYSLWQMSHWSLAMGMEPVIISGLVQGLGMGLIFIPLNTMAFFTSRIEPGMLALSRRYRQCTAVAPWRIAVRTPIGRASCRERVCQYG